VCGIFGICSSSGVRFQKEHFLNIKNVMQHRGPDDEGTYHDENIFLGHCRLSIIDLTSFGHQPMSNEDNTLWIVYNGEIYNYKELNVELSRHGHQIRSNCDTETIIHLYEEFGKECVHHLRGMFAFVIWDIHTKTLFSARDQFGIKPLYYSQVKEKLVFASELKALIASGLVPKVINPTAIWHYLSFGAIPTPLTIWKDIWTLPPAHRLTFCNGRVEIEQYWDPKTTQIQSEGKGMTEQEAVSEVRRLLEEAVHLQLISDVPLGAFLSGGIDSSTIVGLMTQFSHQPIRTFSVGYDVGGDKFDERRFALMAARHFETDHQELLVTCQDLISKIEKIIWYMDQPSHDALNSFVVSQAAASGVKVALSGLGGDELFGGYSTFKFISLLHKFHWVKRNLPSWVKQTAVKLEKALHMRYRAQWPLRVCVGIGGGYDTIIEQFAIIRFFFTDIEKRSLLSPDFLSFLRSDDQHNSSLHLLRIIADSVHDSDLFNQISYLELKTYMGDVLLRDMDVMSMANSLEVRVPLIDQKLVEFVISLPGYLKQDGSRKSKHLLIESVKDLIPIELLYRRKKGFALPMPIWLLEPGLREIVEDCLSEQSVHNRGIFDWPAVRQTKREFYERNQFGNSGQVWLRVWILTVLELWFRTYLSGFQQEVMNGTNVAIQ